MTKRPRTIIPTTSTAQKIITAIVPESWAQRMEGESKTWVFTCSCGHKMSIWDLGGIRWKASGNPKKLIKCTTCKKSSFMTVVKEA